MDFLKTTANTPQVIFSQTSLVGTAFVFRFSAVSFKKTTKSKRRLSYTYFLQLKISFISERHSYQGRLENLVLGQINWVLIYMQQNIIIYFEWQKPLDHN